MATLGTITELRTLPQLTQLSDVVVTADEEIVQIEGVIQNNGVTFISIQAFFEDAGKVYLETPSGKRHYLTDSNQNWPAKYQVLSTYLLPKGEVVSLKYSANTTMTGLCIVASGGVF